MEIHVDQHGGFGRVPIVEIVRGELIVPLQFAGGWVEGQNGIGIEVVAPALIAVEIGTRVADRPEQRARFRIVGAGQPG